MIEGQKYTILNSFNLNRKTFFVLHIWPYKYNMKIALVNRLVRPMMHGRKSLVSV